MKLVIEIEDFSNPDVMRRYLANMQKESDEYAAEEPGEYNEGFGPLALETSHMAVSARIIGILSTGLPGTVSRGYAILPISQEK